MMALQFDTDAPTMRAVRKFVHDLVLSQGGSEEDASAVEIATGEVLNNAYEHVYAGRSGPLEIDLLYVEAKVELTIHNRKPRYGRSRHSDHTSVWQERARPLFRGSVN
jgi:anti-sigma regulatory factor (Ser/Thr protein kinase)